MSGAVNLKCFNPTLVRLRREVILATRRLFASFNPTLVRLRQDPFATNQHVAYKFQSHAGSIEAWSLAGPRGQRRRQFQSHAGSIEAFEVPHHPHGVRVVSIPRWFD